MSLTIENLSNIININNELLSVKELLKLAKYDINDVYIDRFWNSIKENKWIYINNKEFTNISMEHLCSIENIDINTHNKVKHIIVSPKCFKKSLIMLRTNKSEEIKDYYI
jgi:hypothetical protein